MSELYTLPDGWEWKKLDLVCKFIRGPFGGSLKKQIFKDSGNAVYEQSHAIYNQFEQIRYFIDDEKFEEMKRFELVPNSLIMSCSGTIGKVAIVPNNVKKGIINQALLMLITNEKLNNIFLKLLMESNFFQNLLSENSTGAAISNVASVKVLKEIQIPLPPLEEQKRIVAKLDILFAKIDKAIDLHQKNIDEANVFMASVLNDVFVELEEKYEKLFLNDVSTFQNGFAFKSNEFNTIGNGLQVIRIGNVLDINKNQVFIEKRQEFEKYLMKENDIVISMTGTRGKKDYLFVRVITTNNSYLNQRVGKISNKNNSNYMYLYYFLQSNYFRDKIFEFETGTVNQGNISSKDILNTKIPLPNMQVQQKVVSYLDEISQKMENIKQIQKEKMQSLKALKASILDQAFKGEL